MTYVVNRMLCQSGHDAVARQPAVYVQEANHGSSSKQTDEGSSQETLVCPYRQVRFARWFGFIAEDAKLDQFFRIVTSTEEAKGTLKARRDPPATAT